MMHKADYEVLAKAIRDAGDGDEPLVRVLIRIMKDDNPRFDEGKFLKACGAKPK